MHDDVEILLRSIRERLQSAEMKVEARAAGYHQAVGARAALTKLMKILDKRLAGAATAQPET